MMDISYAERRYRYECQKRGISPRLVTFMERDSFSEEAILGNSDDGPVALLDFSGLVKEIYESPYKPTKIVIS
tara:strand:+ start:35 stop:253 length:219 start_codon:yes stop_codon:yes gene_type:complete